MPQNAPEELIHIVEQLSAAAIVSREAAFNVPLDALLSAAEQVAATWSGSNFGFHANIYYRDFQPPPPGHHFDSEWGFLGQFQGTSGDWQEYPHDFVMDHVKDLAGDPDLSDLERDSEAAARIFRDAKDDAISILRTHLRDDDDEHARSLLEEIEGVEVLEYRSLLRQMLPQGPYMSRDTTAISQGLKAAPHQEVAARVFSIRAPFEQGDSLASACRRTARHLERIGAPMTSPANRANASRVVIGHGHSSMWKELKDFIADRLNLDWDGFSRVPTAGVATVARLQEMLDSSAFALLVATAEDETAQGKMVARQNVIHEIGLFQGRLGYSRAIVLLEEGCEEFSNIHGLGQIRFPAGRIAVCFESVREVLEREGILSN